MPRSNIPGGAYAGSRRACTSPITCAVDLDREIEHAAVTPRARMVDPRAHARLRRSSSSGAHGVSNVAAVVRLCSPQDRRSPRIANGRSVTPASSQHDPHGRGRPCHGGRNTLVSGTILPSEPASCSRSRSRSCSSSVSARSASSCGLQLDDRLHAGEIDAAFLREVLDLTEQRDVAVGIPAGVARRALRRDQPLPLVDPERLRVHAGELGRDADDVDGTVLVALLLLRHLSSPPIRLAATSRSPRPAARRNFFCSFDSLRGHVDHDRREQVAVPAAPLRRALAADPERLAARRARGHLQRHRARAASAPGRARRARPRGTTTGTSTVRSLPLRPKQLVRAHLDAHEQVARAPARGAGLALAGQLDPGAVLHAGGHLHLDRALASGRARRRRRSGTASRSAARRPGTAGTSAPSRTAPG